MLAAITLLRDRKDIQWVFVGDGRRRTWLERQVLERGLAETVQVLGSFPPEKMPSFFAIADALLITLRDEQIFSLTVPSKLQTYLACGRPILGAISGEAASILITSGAGLVAQPSDPERLAEMASAMAQMSREQLDALGSAALEYHRNEFKPGSMAGSPGKLDARTERRGFDPARASLKSSSSVLFRPNCAVYIVHIANNNADHFFRDIGDVIVIDDR